jgi:hypothetical protein
LQTLRRRFIVKREDETRDSETIYRLYFDNLVALRVFGCGLRVFASREENASGSSVVPQTFETKKGGAN